MYVGQSAAGIPAEENIDIEQTMLEKWTKLLSLASQLSGATILFLSIEKQDAEIYENGRKYGLSEYRTMTDATLPEDTIKKLGRLIRSDAFKGMIEDASLIVFPIKRPSGKTFGALCILGKRNREDELYKRMAEQCAGIVADDIAAAVSRSALKNMSELNGRLQNEIKNNAQRFTDLFDKNPGAQIALEQLLNLERIVEERTCKLRQAMLNTAYAAATMLDLRDPYTAGHQNRVGKLAAAIGRELGLADDAVEGLRLTGCVHDIGKITVPSDILNKPGKLSPPEYEIIKLHAEKGYEVFKNYEMPWPVAEIIYQHHERLNGSGYPRGLSNGEIMQGTRIISVADVVEAMMTNRPYRPKIGLDSALNEIQSNKGVLYDTDAVDACTVLLAEKGYTLD